MNKRVVRYTIICCWIVLFALFIIKLCGGNWFEIVVQNERFISVCNYINNTLLFYIVSAITSITANMLLLLAICRAKYFKPIWAAIALLSLLFSYSMKVVFPVVSMWFDFVVIIVFTYCYCRRIIRPILGIGLNLIFQLISLTIRNISISEPVRDNSLVALILMIDVYIMLVLYYLYTNYKEAMQMGIWFNGWLSDQKAQELGYNEWKQFCCNIKYFLSFKWAKKNKE